MINEDPAAHIDRPLLDAAQAAVEKHDLGRADALFLEHLARARADPFALAKYGNFCLRTGRPESACYLLCKANALTPDNADLLCQLGYARLEAEDSKKAAHSFEAALQIDPRNATASYGLALCRQQSGAWPEAVALLESALAAQPDTLPILLNLAMAYCRTNDVKQAVMRFEQAERQAPTDPAMLLEFGKCLRENGLFQRAMQKFNRCAREYPNDPLVMLEIARCLLSMSDYRGAMMTLEQLNELSPDMPEFHVEYGNCYASANRHSERDLHWLRACGLWIDAKHFDLAEPLLKKMLDASPNFASAWNQRGLFYDARAQLELAEAAFLKAIEVDPSLPDPYVNLGNLYEHSNRIAEARLMAESGLRCVGSGPNFAHPALVGLHILRSKIARREKQYRLGLEHLDAIADLHQSHLEQQTAMFERAKLFDLLDDTKAAFETFNVANALARAELGEESAENNKFRLGVQYMLNLAGKGWLKTWSKITPDPAVASPAFLVGFPRSGTTLLNTILYSHSAIHVIEEKQTIAKMLGAVRQMPLSYPHALVDCDAFDVDYMRQAYFAATAEFCTPDPARLLIDKFPMHMATAGLIHRAFPKARFLFALRHPCDAVLSCFMQNFKLNEAMANFCTIGDTVELYTRTMDLWQEYRKQLSLTVHTIRYEDVVDDFDGQIHALCAFLQVPWEERLRQFSIKALDRGRINTPSYEQVSRPIYREARYRWERYRKHLEPFLPALQPYIDRFGYSDTSRSG